MKEKYLLDATIYYYSKNGESTDLSSNYINSYDYNKLKTIFDSFPGKIHKGEYEPEHECIKCSVILTRVDDDDKYEEMMIEKYIIYNFKDIVDLKFLELQDLITKNRTCKNKKKPHSVE